MQLVALGFLIAGPAGEAVIPGTTKIGLGLLRLAALLTLYTGWDYMKAGIKHTMSEAEQNESALFRLGARACRSC